MRKLSFILSLVVLFSSFNAQSQNGDSASISRYQMLQEVDSLMAVYKFERALDLLDILVQQDSLNIGILLRLGQCNTRLGASGAAIRPYEKVLSIDSSHLGALNQLGQLYSRDGDLGKAQRCYVRLIEVDSTNSYYYKQAGSAASRAGDKAKAVYFFQQALNFNPADMESALALGNIFMDLEAYESVDSVVQRALAIDPSYRPLIQLQARSSFEQQHFESVVITASQLVKKDTSELNARMLGVSYFYLKQYENMATCMLYLLRNRYDHESIYYYLGMGARELGDVANSVEWLKRAAEKSISENTKVYYAQLAQSYELLGDYAAAIRSYRAAYNYSKDGIMLYHLARNYDTFYKDKSLALEYYKKYLESEDTIRLAREYARKRMRDMGVF